MNICTKCKREMHCTRNGVIVRFNKHYCFSGDKFQCSECKSEFITGFGQSFEHKGEIDKKFLIEMS